MSKKDKSIVGVGCTGMMFTSDKVRKCYDGNLEHATAGSAGYDLRAFSLDACDSIVIPAYGKLLVGTGVKINLDDVNLVGKVYPRSSLGVKKGITLANTVGIIDSDYQGEIKLCLQNNTGKDVELSAGERVAQLLIESVVHTKFVEVDKFIETDRGSGGFGSTGE